LSQLDQDLKCIITASREIPDTGQIIPSPSGRGRIAVGRNENPIVGGQRAAELQRVNNRQIALHADSFVTMSALTSCLSASTSESDLAKHSRFNRVNLARTRRIREAAECVTLIAAFPRSVGFLIVTAERPADKEHFSVATENMQLIVSRQIQIRARTRLFSSKDSIAVVPIRPH
jgi:hypothetical protein